MLGYRLFLPGVFVSGEQGLCFLHRFIPHLQLEVYGTQQGLHKSWLSAINYFFIPLSMCLPTPSLLWARAVDPDAIRQMRTLTPDEGEGCVS